jgi:cytochrome c556
MKAQQLVIAIALVLACRATGSEPKPEASARPSAVETMSSANEALDKLDQRRPVPLSPMMAQHQKQNMREHLQAVQEVVTAAAVGNFEQVALAAKRMGFSETMGRMCQHMGAGAPGFAEQALRFHHTADEIAVAASTRDADAVMTALSKTLSECTSCHATFKQQLVANFP